MCRRPFFVLSFLAALLLVSSLGAQPWCSNEPIPLPENLDTLIEQTTVGGPAFTGEIPLWHPYRVDERRRADETVVARVVARARLEGGLPADAPLPASLARLAGLADQGYFEIHELWALTLRDCRRSLGQEGSPSFADWEASSARSILFDEGLTAVLAVGDLRDDEIRLPSLVELEGRTGQVPMAHRPTLEEGGLVDLLCQFAYDEWARTYSGAFSGGEGLGIEILPEARQLGINDWSGFKARLIFAAQSGCLWPHEIWAMVHLQTRRALRQRYPDLILDSRLRQCRSIESWYGSSTRQTLFAMAGGLDYFSQGLAPWDLAAGPDAGAPTLDAALGSD